MFMFMLKSTHEKVVDDLRSEIYWEREAKRKLNKEISSANERAAQATKQLLELQKNTGSVDNE